MGRTVLAVVVFVSVLWAAAVPVRGDSLDEVEGKGLILRSTPSGARVYIDGIERGLTPLTYENMAPGSYGVRLHKDGYQDRRFWVTVKENSRIVAAITLEEILGQVMLNLTRKDGSPPPEKLDLKAEVSVEGKTLSDPVLNLPVGYRTIRVRAFGWEEANSTVYVKRNEPLALTVELTPAPFRMTGAAIRRSRFNPENSGSLGTTEFSFDVSAPGNGWLTILDTNGETVFTKELGPFSTWSQSMVWNGRTGRGEPLPDGTYTALIRTESIPWDNSPPAEQRAEIRVTIDESIDIHPLALSAGISGLLFTPVPEALPPGAFQIDGNLLFGKPPLAEKVWTALPFSAAFRVSPLAGVELAGALNVKTDLDNNSVTALGGSVKWAFRPSKTDSPPGIAAALSYAWAEEGTLTPYGMGIGLQFGLPLSWRLDRAFSLILTPAVLWTGEEGYPAEALPRLLLSGGVLFRRSFITAGVSLRSEYAFSGDGVSPGTLMVGGEIKFFPPPSSFVFTLLGGGWFKNGRAGGFGGAGIGLIY